MSFIFRKVIKDEAFRYVSANVSSRTSAEVRLESATLIEAFRAPPAPQVIAAE